MLIINLLDWHSLDRDLVESVLLTQHYFIPPGELFERLAGHYDPFSKQKWRILLRMRVLGLLKIWLDQSQGRFVVCVLFLFFLSWILILHPQKK